MMLQHPPHPDLFLFWAGGSLPLRGYVLAYGCAHTPLPPLRTKKAAACLHTAASSLNGYSTLFQERDTGITVAGMTSLIATLR